MLHEKRFPAKLVKIEKEKLRIDEKYMKRCLQLAGYGKGFVAPNPVVGSVIVHGDKIIGEGFHRRYGEAHAEVNAINSVADKSLLSDSTLYVNLEPCSHYGKTPPCAELIIKKQIPRVVIGLQDPYLEVSGRGIQMLRDAGVEVVTDVLPDECNLLNKRFLTFVNKERPYIILKWAESNDGYMDKIRIPGDGNQAVRFSDFFTQVSVHKMRTEESAVMVGANTVLLDRPMLNARFWSGANPLRITIDKDSKIRKSGIFSDGSIPTLIFTQSILSQIMDELYRRKVQSLIVEGGAKLLESFIMANLWDEARIETAGFSLGSGIKSPVLSGKLFDTRKCEKSIISIYKNVFIP